jgi:Holliday junction resolvase RusA-like endonuclease
MSQRRGSYKTARVKMPKPAKTLQKALLSQRHTAAEFCFFIPGEFTQLNDYIDSERGNKYGAAGIKSAETLRAYAACDGLPTPSSYPVAVTLTWFREDRRTDPDNIAFAVKFVLDGLVQAGVLRDDGMDEIDSITHRYRIDKTSPGVEVAIAVVT